jgi:hypothetical protein
MKRVLLTGARAPATLDLARRFHSRGHQVFLCDSLRFPLARFSRCKTAYHGVPPPQLAPERYIDAINQIVAEHKIDLVIPTCEECFFLSLFCGQIKTQVCVESLPLLDRLHNKFSFSQFFGNPHAAAPASIRLESRRELEPFFDCSTEFVFKPVYSRFAAKTQISPTAQRLARLNVSPENPWVAQRRIFGREFSSYCLSCDGKLMAWSAYESLYRAGPGAGIYFKPASHPAILPYIKAFLTQTNYTGQIGFDFIADGDGKLWVLEANPRSTSGIHLFETDGRLVDCFLGNSSASPLTASQKPNMVAGAMCLWGIAQAVKSGAPLKFARACFAAKDVLFKTTDPFPFLTLPISFGELLWTAVSQQVSVQAASTRGIEWNKPDASKATNQ